ncbi:MAG: NADPH-dependent FMN reductase [Candidatus Dojkabacteria bacterium]
MHILIILGTDRENSMSKHVAEYVLKKVQNFDGVEQARLADPAMLNITYNSSSSTFSKMVEKADGYVIVSPEYNHGYPGTLKTMIDSEFKNYNHKPVLFVPVSSGGFGGARMVEMLNSVCKAVGLTTIREDLYVSMVKDFVKNGEFQPAKDWDEKFDSVFSNFIWYVRTLKWGRENLAD